MMNNTTSTDPSLPWAGGAYSIKRHGVTISNCDSEPVQTPGCIQAHGAMLVVQPGDFTVLQVSENVGAHFGRTPEELLGQPVATVLGEEGARRLREVLDREPVERNPLYVFTLPAREAAPALDLTAHLVDGVAVIECEPTARAEAEPDYCALVKQSVGRMQSAQTLGEFCQIAAEQVRALSGLDRVMAYRFHEDFHGEVVAESKREDLSPWLGLHYPAEDIPRPAREIVTKIWVRPLPDAAEPVMALVPLVNPATQRPLNMTHCAALR